jgi:hypothetical protein
MSNEKLTCEYLVPRLVDSKNKLYSGNNSIVILQILMDNFPNIENFYFLQWRPDQGEDFFYILVNAESVAIIEVPRPGNELSTGAFCKQISLVDYLKHRLTNDVRRNVKIALKMMSELDSQ